MKVIRLRKISVVIDIEQFSRLVCTSVLNTFSVPALCVYSSESAIFPRPVGTSNGEKTHPAILPVLLYYTAALPTTDEFVIKFYDFGDFSALYKIHKNSKPKAKNGEILAFLDRLD